jgi:hypothetical protein
LGWVASVTVGAVAAVAAFYIFPPLNLPAVSEGGKIVAQAGVQYDVVKTVALSLIVGSIGSVSLAAMQTRALALVKDQQAKTTETVASNQLAAIDEQVKGGASPESVSASLQMAQKAVSAVNSTSQGNPPEGGF